MTPYLRVTVPIVMLVTLAACQPGGRDAEDDQHEEPQLQQEDIPVVTNSADLVLPLDQYMWSDEEYRTFQQAQIFLVRDCVERFGETTETSLSDVSMPRFELRNEGRYGRLNLESAQVRGYRPPPELMQETSESDGAKRPSERVELLIVGREDDRFADREPPVDINGDPLHDAGCGGEARDILTAGATGPSLSFPEGLANEAYHQAETSRPVEHAMTEWSTCMTGKGYDYEDIWEARNKDWPDPVGDEQIATAVADMECMIDTNLVGVWHAMESAYQERMIDEHAEQLSEVREWLDALYRRSADVVA